MVQVGSTAAGDGASLVILKDGLISFNRHGHWLLVESAQQTRGTGHVLVAGDTT